MSRSSTPEEVAEKLAAARTALAQATERAEALSRPSNPYETDMATVSGIRRKRNARADARRYARYDREAEAWRRVRAAAEEVSRLERALATARRNTPVPFTAEQLKAAQFVRDDFGWHRVVRVNAKSVSVETGYSWTDRIELGRIIEVRSAGQDAD